MHAGHQNQALHLHLMTGCVALLGDWLLKQ